MSDATGPGDKGGEVLEESMFSTLDIVLVLILLVATLWWLFRRNRQEEYTSATKSYTIQWVYTFFFNESYAAQKILDLTFDVWFIMVCFFGSVVKIDWFFCFLVLDCLRKKKNVILTIIFSFVQRNILMKKKGKIYNIFMKAIY